MFCKGKIVNFLAILVSCFSFLFCFGCCSANGKFSSLIEIKKEKVQNKDQQKSWEVPTENCVLRLTSGEENRGAAKILSTFSPEEMKFFNGVSKQLTEEDAIKNLSDDSVLNITIYDKKDLNKVIGQIGIEFESLGKDLFFTKLFIFLDKSYRHKKIAVEALLPVVKYLLQADDVVIINACCYKRNEYSVKLMDRVCELIKNDSSDLFNKFADKSMVWNLSNSDGEFYVGLYVKKENNEDSVFGKLIEIIRSDASKVKIFQDYFERNGGEFKLGNFLPLFSSQKIIKDVPEELFSQFLTKIGLLNEMMKMFAPAAA